MSLTPNSYTFADVFPEYYASWRGRVTNLPTFTSNEREYKLAIHYGNQAIKKWARTDGMLWRELIDLGSRQTTTVWPTIQRTIASGTLTYTMPSNMRKPPAFVRIGTGTTDVPIIEPQEALDMASNTTYGYFVGGANNSFTLVLPSALTTQYNGETMDFVYDKKPTLLTLSADPASTVIEMSDPNFMIQYMLMLRSIKQRTGFVYQTARTEATETLQAMKIENTSGNYAKTWNAAAKELGGWGKPARGESFFGVR